MNDKREVRELVQAVIDAGALPADYPMIVNENEDQRIPGLSTLMHYRLVRALQKDLDSPALFGDIRNLSDQDIREFDQVGPKTMAHLKETLLALLPSESTEKWDALVPTMYLLLSNGWRVVELEKDGRAWDSYVLQAERGDWLLEIMTCEGLTDDCVLALPGLNKFLRLSGVGELQAILSMTASEIWNLWTSRKDKHQEGEKRPALGSWTVEYSYGGVSTAGVVASRDKAFDLCLEVAAAKGDLIRLLRPDGMTELDGQELRTAMFAYEENKRRNA